MILFGKYARVKYCKGMSMAGEARGEFFKKRSFCIVTGASRGLGKEIAIQLAREWNKESMSVGFIKVFCQASAGGVSA